MVKWVPKTTSSSTSSSMTTTPRIPIKLMWIPKKKSQRVFEGDSANKLHSYSFGKDKCKQLPYLALVHGVTNPLVVKTRDKVTQWFHGHHHMCVLLYVYGYSCMFLMGLTRVGIESATHSKGLLQTIYINVEHLHLQHLHEVIIDKPQGQFIPLRGDITSRGSFSLKIEQKQLK